MAKRVGIIGVPIEDLFIWGNMSYVTQTYIPHITDGLRKKILEECSKNDIVVEDLGEVYLGEDYEHPYPTDRYEDVPDRFIPYMRPVNPTLLDKGREATLESSRDYDLVVGVGHSHMGAIVLYDDLEQVARLDYHGDFRSEFGPDHMLNFACYMNWVKDNLVQADVLNYFVTSKKDYLVFGERARGLSDRRYIYASHFDIDVDCVDERFRIQDCYIHVDGSTGIAPDDIVRMVSEARPNKLGFWEYRLNHDNSGGLGLKMIADCIRSAVQSKPGQWQG